MKGLPRFSRATRDGISRRTLLTTFVGAAGVAAVAGGIMQYGATFARSSSLVEKAASSPPGTVVQTFGPFHAVRSVDWSPDGLLILSSVYKNETQLQTHVWNAVTGNHILTVNKPYQRSVWAPDSIRIASLEDISLSQNRVVVWNRKTKAVLFASAITPASFSTLNWSQNGQYLVAGAVNGWVYLLDGRTGKALLIYKGHKGLISETSFSPDSGSIVSAADDLEGVHVWNVKTGKLLISYKGHTGDTSVAAWSPDGQHIASGLTDGPKVHVWKVSTGNAVFIHQLPVGWLNDVAWASGGRRIAAISPVGIHIRDAFSGANEFVFKATSFGLDYSPNGKYVVSDDGEFGQQQIKIWIPR